MRRRATSQLSLILFTQNVPALEAYIRILLETATCEQRYVNNSNIGQAKVVREVIKLFTSS